jgi:hypothetical protein
VDSAVHACGSGVIRRLRKAGEAAGHGRHSATRKREPWLLVASPELDISAPQLVKLYARRMQIEESFRDLKSHRFGYAFVDSLTRKAMRRDILLLIHALALYANWLAGLACAANGMDQWLMPIRSKRKLYSILRVGREALVRRWPIGRVALLVDRLHNHDASLLDQLGLPA